MNLVTAVRPRKKIPSFGVTLPTGPETPLLVYILLASAILRIVDLIMTNRKPQLFDFLLLKWGDLRLSDEYKCIMCC